MIMRTNAFRSERKKTVEDVGEFAFRFDINSPTVFQIRSEKEKSPDAREKAWKKFLICDLNSSLVLVTEKRES